MYPELTPYHTDFLKASALHSVYYEEGGNPKGEPVLFIHGGPGGGIDARCYRFFNPKRYRVILVDQRGCGKSLPYAELRENTTDHLIADFEALRQHLGIESWTVFGGSWGSTLALAYAQKHPHTVQRMVLRGIFLGVKDDLQWLYQKGASEIFPDYWEVFRDFIPEDERHDFMSAYHRRLTGNDPIVQAEAAKIWSIWEAYVSKLYISQDLLNEYSTAKHSIAFARIESHYFMNHLFLTPNQLIKNVDKIRHIPTIIVHGRYDMCCPLRSAWELHKAWPESTLIIVPDSGHSASETGTETALIAAMDGSPIILHNTGFKNEEDQHDLGSHSKTASK